MNIKLIVDDIIFMLDLNKKQLAEKLKINQTEFYRLYRKKKDDKFIKMIYDFIRENKLQLNDTYENYFKHYFLNKNGWLKMIDTIKILNEVQNAKGKEKIDILKRNKDNEILKEILFYTYNPYLVFHIAEKRLNKFLCSGHSTNELHLFDWYEYKSILDKILKKDGVSDLACETLAGFILQYDRVNQNILTNIIYKDLRIGLSSKSINKVWVDLIPEYKIQLAEPCDDDEYLKFEKIMISRKFNGLRCCFFKYENKIFGISRGGLLFEFYSEIKKQLLQISMMNDYVLDGEIITLKNGIEDFNKTISISRRKEKSNKDDDNCFVIFDVIDKNKYFETNKLILERIIGKFNFEKSKVKNGTMYQNYKMIYNYFQIESDKILKTFYHKTKYKNIFLAHQVICQSNIDCNQVNLLFQHSIKQKWEGLMIKDGGKEYQFKRNKNILKMKDFNDDEFEIINFIEGCGKYKNNLGSIIIKLKSGESVGVGSGFKDCERKIIWDRKDYIMEKKLSLHLSYKQITKDKNGNNSLQFPIFLNFRLNKEDISIDEIKNELI